MTMRPHQIFLAVTAVGVVPLLFAAAAAQQAVEATPPDDEEVIELRRYAGVARASKELVITAPTDGLLGRVNVEEGETVTLGQQVAAMDDRVQRAVVEVARLQAGNRAPIVSAEQSAKFFAIELETAKELVERDAANPREARLAEVQLAQAEAEVMNAEARLKEAAATLKLESERLAQLQIIAPFSGKVMEAIAEPGASVRVADPVLRIARLDPLEVKLPLPAELYARLAIGRSYRLDAGVPVNRLLRATLVRRADEIDPASDTFIAVFQIPNPRGELPAGVRVHLADIRPVAEPETGAP